MDPMETLVRATLADRAEDAPGAGGLLDAVRAADTSAGRHRWWYAGLAAAVVVAIAVSVGVLTRGGGGGAGQPVAHPARPTSSTSLACPTCPALPVKQVSYHGITLAVPSRLPVINAVCGWPIRAVLALDPDMAIGCPSVSPKTKTGPAISLTPYNATDRRLLRLATEPVTVNGRSALRGSGRVPRLPGVTHVLALPRPGVVVAVSAKNGASTRFVLPSVHVTPVDRFGCRARTSARVVTNPPAPRLVPGHPRSAIVCAYARDPRPLGPNLGEFLIGSLRLNNVDRLESVLNDLPRHPPANTGAYIPPSFEIVFHYTRGNTQTVLVQRNSIPALVTDGRITAIDQTGAVQLLLEHVR